MRDLPDSGANVLIATPSTLVIPFQNVFNLQKGAGVAA
jgi:hypothetical protein